jgi:hypothetical protein
MVMAGIINFTPDSYEMNFSKTTLDQLLKADKSHCIPLLGVIGLFPRFIPARPFDFSPDLLGSDSLLNTGTGGPGRPALLRRNQTGKDQIQKAFCNICLIPVL